MPPPAPIIPDFWFLAAFDPVLIIIAVLLGWKADQFGKLIVATIAAFTISVVVAWAITALGLPWIAAVSRDNATLFPVRMVAAFLWALAGFAAARIAARRS